MPIDIVIEDRDSPPLSGTFDEFAVSLSSSQLRELADKFDCWLEERQGNRQDSSDYNLIQLSLRLRMTLEVKLSLSAWTDIMSEYDMPMLRSQGGGLSLLRAYSSL